MRDVASKQDDVGDTLSAESFNSDQAELENAVTSSEQVLDPAGGPDTTLNMLAQAMAAYANASSTYVDTGTANAKVLELSDDVDLLACSKYYANMKVTFKALLGNTGAATVNVSGLGAKDITLPDGTALTSGDIAANAYYEIIYNLSNDRFELLQMPYPEKTYSVAGADFTVASTGGSTWTDIGSTITVYRTSNGIFRIKPNLHGTIAPLTASITIEISGIVFTSSDSLSASTGDPLEDAITSAGDGEIDITSTTTFNSCDISGDVELTTKPTWAD